MNMDPKKVSEAKMHLQKAMEALDALGADDSGSDDDDDMVSAAPESKPMDDTSANSLKMKLGKYKT